ncbi:CHAT domain-containing protein [Tolypothrix campylonemoides VB511288]|nr:CHAT domain-containing protein [Tolypothrix campylonemoides VB511288]
MDKVVTLHFVDGDFQQGFIVTLQIVSDGALIAEIKGKLPPCPELPEYYKTWQQAYYSAYSRAITPQPGIIRASIYLDPTVGASEDLRLKLNAWLNHSQEFSVIRERLKENLRRDDIIRVILQAEDPILRKLPWQLWKFFERYPNAELALSTPSFEEPLTVTPRNKVRILAILGNSKGIDINTDRRLLQEKLGNTEIVFLVEPSRQELNDQLWDDKGWDILFFAGHGKSDGETGIIHINRLDSVTIQQLNKALTKAIQRGLRLAIFNSCDGLGLARQLSDLQMPQVIVMREPVPDRVAQEFLKYFLDAFASGQPLYLAVRQARERLQGIENEFPCASWLPVLCQNPAAKPLNWIDLGSISHCPYKGLSAFRQEDKLVFFGRQAFTQRLLEAVRNKPLVAVVGPSGRGKSSVVFAGLVPYLQEEDNWQIAHFRPGQRPFDALAAALLGLVSTQDDPSSLQTPHVLGGSTYSAGVGHEGQQEPEQLERLCQIQALATQLRLSKDGLTEFISSIQSHPTLPTPQLIVLIADQFEELYTLCTNFEERERFLDCLLNAVSDTPSFKLVLTLRSDFYGYAQSYRPFNDALEDNCLNLGPMNEQELREAIARPAQLCGVTLEAGLVKRILNDVGQRPNRQENDSPQKSPPDKLPLLEFALKQLWAEATKHGTRQLTNEAYDKIGGIEKALGKYAEDVYRRLLWAEATKRVTRQLTNDAYDQIGGIERALGLYAEDVYRRLREEYKLQKRQIKRIFTQLVRPGETTATEHTRRLATRRELGEENWELVNRLNNEDVRLVVIGHDEATNEETVEVVHEALIRGWERLKKWVNSDRDFLTWQERLRKDMRDWENGGNKKDDLLRGTSLDLAKGWLEKRPEDISAAERLFIEEGLELRDRQRQKEERDRQRELEAARKLRKLAIIAIIATVLMSVTAYFALSQSENFKIRAESANASATLELDGLTASLKVGKELEKLQHSGRAEDSTGIEVLKELQQVVDSVSEKNRLTGHIDQVNSVSFSPDGQTIATASADKTIKLWRRNGSLIDTLTWHSDEVQAVSFSPDKEIRKQIIATASADKTVKLWRHDGSLIDTLTGHNDKVLGVTFSPDGQMIASASADKTIKLWRRNGSLIDTLTGHNDKVLGVAFSPDGQMIATASADNTVKLWQRNGSLINTLRGHNERVYAVSFSPDGKMLASASEDNTVKLWQLNGSPITTLTGHRYRVHSISFSPDGKILASGSGDNTIKLWRVVDNSLMTTLTGHSNEVLQVTFSPDKNSNMQIIASASADKTVKLWKLKYSIGHKAPVWDLDFSRNGDYIVSGSQDKTIKLWRKDGELDKTFEGHDAGVMDVDFNPNGDDILSGSEDKTVKLWSREGKYKTKTFNEHTAGVTGVIFSQDGKIIASTSKDKTIKLWQQDKDNSLATLRGHTAEVTDVSLSPDGQIIASASWDKTIKLWQIIRQPDGSLKVPNIGTLKGHNAAVNDVTFSWERESDAVNDVKQERQMIVASASADKTIKLWRLKWRQDGSLIIPNSAFATLEGHSAGVTDVNISKKRGTIISASDDKTIKLWKQDGTLITTLTGHSAAVTDINPRDDGTGFASSSTDGTVIIWNLNIDLNNLDDLLKRGCALAKDYLKNPNNGMNENDPQRWVCDDVK